MVSDGWILIGFMVIVTSIMLAAYIYARWREKDRRLNRWD